MSFWLCEVSPLLWLQWATLWTPSHPLLCLALLATLLVVPSMASEWPHAQSADHHAVVLGCIAAIPSEGIYAPDAACCAVWLPATIVGYTGH